MHQGNAPQPVQAVSQDDGGILPQNPMMLQYPLKDISVPHPHDVLCGRGGATNNHLGNSHWRMLVATNKELYVTLPKRQKQLLSRSIVHAVRSQNPPGRFLQRDSQTDLWYDVGDARATEKTSQALREGAPKLRDKIKKGDDEATKPEITKSKKAPPEAPPIIVHPPPTSSAKAAAAKSEPEPQLAPPESRPAYAAPPPPPPPPPPQQHPVPLAPPQPRYAPASDTMPPPPTALDPAGDFSFGTISVPDAPDMGLENGFSFGSVMSVDPQQHRYYFTRNSATNFAPPTGLQGNEYSFGSVTMSDAEQRRVENHQRQQQHPSRIDEKYEQATPVDFGLERGGLSTGSVMSIGTIQTLAGMDPSASDPNRKAQMISFGPKKGVSGQQRQHVYQEQYHHDNHEAAPQPVDYGLEHGGLSAGSMMSIGTIKLEDVGTSFGSVMSFATRGPDVPGAVDGGLDDVGTSFGSMTLGGGAPPPPQPPADRASFEPPEPLDAAEPTLLHQQRSRADLLDCGDSDSEDEQHSAQASLQKSAEWEKLKATFEAQMQSGMYSDRPPSLYGMGSRQQQQPGSSVILPVAKNRTGTNDSFGNMPPPASRKDDEWRAYEATMLNRGDSLAGEDFDVPKQAEDPLRHKNHK